MGRIVFLVWIVKDKEAVRNLDCFSRNSVGLANVLNLFFIRSITRVSGHIVCQWFSFVFLLLTSQNSLCCSNFLRREILLVEIMGMVPVSDHIALIILADDLIRMKAMIVLLFLLMVMLTLMIVIVRMALWLWNRRKIWCLFSCSTASLGTEELIVSR